jgi:hydrogenase maturation factor HypF (carbamoyltransferase family)
MYKEDPKCLNSNNATETKEERLARKALWHKDNSEKLKDYYKYNSEKVKDWNKQYYKNNCEKVKDRMQKYREANSEKLKQCRKRRYEATREQILEKMREKIECPNCGYQIHRGGIYRHKKTDLCRSFSGAQTI